HGTIRRSFRRQLVRCIADGADGNPHLFSAKLPVILFSAYEVAVAGPPDAETIDGSFRGRPCEDAHRMGSADCRVGIAILRSAEWSGRCRGWMRTAEDDDRQGGN